MNDIPIIAYEKVSDSNYHVEGGVLLSGGSFPWEKLSISKCTYCSGQLSQPVYREHSSEKYYSVYEKVYMCKECGWWYHMESVHGGQASLNDKCKIGIAARYSIDRFDVPIESLRVYLANHPKHIAHVNPFSFESLMASCLKDYLGSPIEVIPVGGRKDRGIDIILIEEDGEKTLVQVKRRKNLLSAEGVSVVRELNGVLFREQEVKGMVISTANRFSKDAKDEARISAVERHEVTLLSFNDVIGLLGVRNFSNSYEPWTEHSLNKGDEWQAKDLR